MKTTTQAIINGKRYDTKTAKKVASTWNQRGGDDFLHIREELFKTPKGEYFLRGQGGAQTKYSVQYGNARYGGSRIVLMTAVEARGWLEQHQEIEALETEFGQDIVDA